MAARRGCAASRADEAHRGVSLAADDPEAAVHGPLILRLRPMPQPNSCSPCMNAPWRASPPFLPAPPAPRNFRVRVRVQISEYTDRTVREDIMKRVLTASVVAGTLAIATIATPTSAQAQWGRRGLGWGLGGLALGLFIGAALSRPAYAYGYGYPAYSYGYGPAYGYGSSGYGYGPEGYASYGYGYPAYSYASYGYPGYGYGGGGTTGQPIAPPIMAVIGQPIVPRSTEVIGSPAGLRSTVLISA